MKTLKKLLLASALLAIAVTGRAETAKTRLESYYQHPNPDAVPGLVRSLTREGYFSRDENIAEAIGFLSTVFARNPDRVSGWMNQFRELPDREQRLLAAALWQAGSPRGDVALRDLSRTSPVGAEVAQLLEKRRTPIDQTSVRSVASMNLQWGAFLASGDRRYVVNILSAIGTHQPGLDQAARYALAEKAGSHPAVLAICRDELSRSPNELNSEVRAALLQATSAPQPRS